MQSTWQKQLLVYSGATALDARVEDLEVPGSGRRVRVAGVELILKTSNTAVLAKDVAKVTVIFGSFGSPAVRRVCTPLLWACYSAPVRVLWKN